MNKYIRSGIIGVTVGDALGLPFEFKSKEEMELNPCTSMVGGGVWNQPRGTWSDDTSMTLATLDSIIRNNGEVNLDSIMRNFVRWYVNADFTQYNDIFDIGITTSDAIQEYMLHADTSICGGRDVRNNGNGSLMRILPLAFTDCNYKMVEDVSALTHAHSRSQIACSLYVEIARQIMKGEYSTFCDCVADASDLIQEYYYGNPELKYFQRIFDVDYTGGVRSSGYVVNTLECAIYCIRESPSFHDALLMAVNLGGDADTVGAVCGGLAGLYYGFDEIPLEWTDCIPNLDYVESLCEKFSEVI